MSKIWRTYIVFHKNIVDKHYEADKDFNPKNYRFLKTNENFPGDYNKKKNYKIVNEWDLGDVYDPSLQQRTYMAPSAIYHIYKNKCHWNLDAVGFMEYDLMLNLNTTRVVDELVNNNENFIVPYSYFHPLKRLHNQSEIRMNNRNAIDMIFKDYNEFFKTKHHYDKYKEKLITSQQSFLCDVETFNRIMKFISYVIEEKLCERPGSWRRPSTLMDRYFGVALMLDETKIYPHSLKHLSMQQWKDVKQRK